MSSVSPFDSLQHLFGDRYRIVSLLGRGGFGSVYQAEQTTTGQSVALKLMHLPTDLSTEEQDTRKSRFLREVAVCARLHHPHIVRLLDGGMTADGVPFTCFSLVPGSNLDTLLSRTGALPLDESVRLMGQVLDGLAAAHEVGVVHRDLKPANIMVSKGGGVSYATILDFGIGALLERSGIDDHSRLTIEGGFIGTPAYSAPEQLHGAPPTPRSDLYAWGLLLLECLTGKPSITGTTPGEIFAKQCSLEPVPIPQALMEHPLGELLATVTQKDVEKRRITAREAFSKLARMNIAGLSLGLPPNPGTLTSASHQSTREGERRPITALVAEFEFTIDNRPLSVDEFAGAIEWLEPRYQALARRFGARYTDKIGSRSLFLFGYPKSNGNDTFRAVQTGQSLLDLGVQFEEQFRAVGIKPKVRVGVDTGLAIVWRPRSQNELPEIVAPAALGADTLVRGASPNQMLIGNASAELVKGRFDLRQHPVPNDTGKQPHGSAFSIICEVPCVTIASAASSRKLAPLVGREHEIAQLRERWQQCLSGIGKGIAIIGEAGVGKSRLAKELLVEASAAGRCIELICTRESQTRPFHPIIELLNQLINPTGDKDPDSRLIGLEKLLLNHGISLTNGVSLLAPLLSLDPKKYVSVLDVSLERVREQTLETLVDLLLEFARNTPLLLLVEDIHWADASTLDFLEKLVGCASDSSLLVLLTARKELRSISPAIWQIALEPLTRVAVKAMLEQMLATTVPESLTDEVTARTGGICLFVEELGSSLLASAAKSGISVENGLEHLPEILIPLRLRDLLTMRLDEVGNARIIAQLAAVIGREFPLDLLAEISKLPKETLLAELKVLLDAELIRERGRSSARQYAFRHALIRDAAYDGLVTSSRSSAHSDIADALTRNIDETKQRPELIAYHLSKAGRYVSAIEFAIKATEQACMRSANEEARSIVSKAEEWLLQVDDENERARLELSLNAIALPVLMACWRWTEDAVRLKSERSLELLKKTQSSPEQARVLWALSMYYMVLADREKCRTVAEQQLALAKQLSDDGMQAAALNSFSGTLMDEGKFSEALRVAESSLGLFDPVAHANHCQSYGLHTGSIARDFRALALCHLGRFQASLVEAELAEQDAIRAGHSASYVLAVFYRALLATLLEDRKLAHSFCKTGIRLAEEHGHRAQLGYFACLDAWAKGELNAMRSSVKTMEDWGQGLGLPFYQSLLAEVEAEHGDPKQALEIIQRSIVRSKDTGNVSFLSASLAVEGTHRLTVAPQAVDEAEKLFREAIAIARSQSALLQELKAVRRLANFLLNCGRDKEALTLLNDYCERLKEEPNVPVVEHLRTLKRFCTTNRNQLVTSQSQFAECAARGMPPSEGSS